MEIQKYPKRRLYEVTRTLILNALRRKIAVYMLDTFKRKSEVNYDALVSKVLGVDKGEYSAIMLFESSPRCLDSFRPNFYMLNRRELCCILKNLVLQFHDDQSMQELARIVMETTEAYVSPVLMLDFFGLRSSEFNEILNFEECLSLSGVKDNGMKFRSPEVETLIKKLLIRC